MIANYHTHTFRCGHASMEDEREYVEAAIAAGIKELGFADHAPMPLSDILDPAECSHALSIRMRVDETEDYVSKLEKLREEYKNDIKIHIGFEVEYIPDLFDGFLEHVSGFPIDYIIMGQHFNSMHNSDMVYFGAPTDSECVLSNYVDLVIQGISTGKFTYLAHPDLCFFTGASELYESEMKRLINAVTSFGVPLEYNLLGMHTGRHYPSQMFWSLADSIGCDVIIGSDAHESVGVYREEEYKSARRYIEGKDGLRLIENVNFRSLK